jgi:Uma2 family endonuclease
MANTLIERARASEQRARLSYEDYLRTIDESTHAEWVEGEATIFMPPTERHQRLHAFMLGILLMFVRATRRGIVLSEPFAMQLRGGRSYREPDLVVILNEHMDRLDGQRLNGPADLVVEIVSRESAARDQREKFAEYELEGVPEYWIVDGRDGSGGVTAYALSPAGRYEAIAPDQRGHLHHSRLLPGFWVDTAWFTAAELPNEFDVLKTLLPEQFRA